MTPEQHARVGVLAITPTRYSQLIAAIEVYASRVHWPPKRIAEWVISDLERGLSISYVLGWLKNTT